MVNPLNIGTPLSRSATRVMLLGSGELGKEVIIALQRLGIETIAVDRYPNAPGHRSRTAPMSLIWQTALHCGNWWNMAATSYRARDRGP